VAILNNTFNQKYIHSLIHSFILSLVSSICFLPQVADAEAQAHDRELSWRWGVNLSHLQQRLHLPEVQQTRACTILPGLPDGR